jgi:hypothetical protein
MFASFGRPNISSSVDKVAVFCRLYVRVEVVGRRICKPKVA